MSFEGDKARLVEELATAQAEVRAKYGMKKRPEPLTDDKSEQPADGKRSRTRD